MNSVSSFDTGWCVVLVKRTKRRHSLSIKIKDGQVQVNIPYRMAAIDVQILLEKKRGWIEQALEKQYLANLETRKTLEPGELFLFQGKRYPLSISQGEFFQIDISADNFLSMTYTDKDDKSFLFDKLIEWYHHQAIAYLTEKTDYYAKKLGHHPALVAVKSYRSRWGSCSSKGEIQYNWRLIMAPPEIINYVVVHELCHLVEHNHSPRFWQLVSTLDEHYLEHRKWLKQNGDILFIQYSKI